MEEQHRIASLLQLHQSLGKKDRNVQIAKCICLNCKIYKVQGAGSSIVSPLLSNYVVGEKRGEMCKSFKTLETDVQTAPA